MTQSTVPRPKGRGDRGDRRHLRGRRQRAPREESGQGLRALVCSGIKTPPPRPTHTPVNMRAALFLATASVVANARPKWRADRAMLPAPATLPGYPTNHTQKHNPKQYTHTLAAQMAVWPAGCFTQQATHACTAHQREAATSLITLQRSAPNFPRVSSPCTAPAHLPALCCAIAQPCMPWRASTCMALAHEHMNAD